MNHPGLALGIWACYQPSLIKEDAILLMQIPWGQDLYDVAAGAAKLSNDRLRRLHFGDHRRRRCLDIALSSRLQRGRRGPTSPWRTGEPLYWLLDQYNNGLLCVPHRD
jgi:hypothetical protein